MRINMIITTLFLLMLTNQVAIANSKNEPSVGAQSKAKMSQSAKRNYNISNKAELINEPTITSIVDKRLTEQDKRIGDLNVNITISGIVIASSIALFGILTTLLIIYFGFKTAKTAAIEAKSEAYKEINEWITSKADSLLSVKIQESVTEANRRIDMIVGPIVSGLEKTQEEASHLSKELKDKIQSISISNHGTNKPTFNRSDLESMSKFVTWLQSRPETLYSNDDWWALGFYAVDTSNFELAIRCFRKSEQTAFDPKRKLLSLYNLCVAFSYADRKEESNKVIDELLDKYGELKEPEVQNIFAKTYSNKSFNLLINAKKHIKNDDVISGKEFLIEANKCVDKALSIQADIPMALENKAYILYLLGKKSESLEFMQRAIDLGGEKIRAAALDDSKIHTINADQAFIEMVNSIELNQAGNT